MREEEEFEELIIELGQEALDKVKLTGNPLELNWN